MSLGKDTAIQIQGLGKQYRGRGAFKGRDFWALRYFLNYSMFSL